MIKIIQSKDKKGYWINGKYVLIENWNLSKHKFSAIEQQQFNNYINNKTMKQQEITEQENFITEYELVGNSIGVAFHKAKLQKLLNEIEVIEPIQIK